MSLMDIVNRYNIPVYKGHEHNRNTKKYYRTFSDGSGFLTIPVTVYRSHISVDITIELKTLDDFLPYVEDHYPDYIAVIVKADKHTQNITYQYVTSVNTYGFVFDELHSIEQLLSKDRLITASYQDRIVAISTEDRQLIS